MTKQFITRSHWSKADRGAAATAIMCAIILFMTSNHYYSNEADRVEVEAAADPCVD